jgi:hypothetical protein
MFNRLPTRFQDFGSTPLVLLKIKTVDKPFDSPALTIQRTITGPVRPSFVLRVKQRGDFSVVLFRPNFMLASEEHPMKVHKNQRLLTIPSPPDIL